MEISNRLQKLNLAACILMPVFLGAQTLVWPDAPEEGKIQYVSSIQDLSAYSSKKNFRQWISQMINPGPDLNFVQPMGIAVNKKMIAVADPGRKGVFLLFRNKKSFIFIDGNTLPNKDLFSPTDVALGENEILVTSSIGTDLWVFNYNGTLNRKLALIPPPGRLTGITNLGELYCAIDTKNHQAVIFDRFGKVIRTFGERGKQNGQLNYPTFVSARDNGNIYITDTMNFRVLIFNADGVYQGFCGVQGMATGQFNRPKGIAVDESGRIYVSDTSFDNFQIFNSDSEFLLVVGRAGHGPGEFLSPTDIAIDSPYIYITDTMNKRIQIFKMLYE